MLRHTHGWSFNVCWWGGPGAGASGEGGSGTGPGSGGSSTGGGSSGGASGDGGGPGGGGGTGGDAGGMGGFAGAVANAVANAMGNPSANQGGAVSFGTDPAATNSQVAVSFGNQAAPSAPGPGGYGGGTSGIGQGGVAGGGPGSSGTAQGGSGFGGGGTAGGGPSGPSNTQALQAANKLGQIAVPGGMGTNYGVPSMGFPAFLSGFPATTQSPVTVSPLGYPPALITALNKGLSDLAQQAQPGQPAPPSLTDLAIQIALGNTVGALGGNAPGGASPGYGDATMGYPAQTPTIGVLGEPQATAAPVGTTTIGGQPAVSIRGPGSDATAPTSTYGGMPGPNAFGQPTIGKPPGPGGANVGGGMPSPADFGGTMGVGDPGTAPYGGQAVGTPSIRGPGSDATAPVGPSTYGGMPSPSSFGPSSVAQAIATQSPENAAISVAQAMGDMSPAEQSQVVGFAIAQAQKTMSPQNYETFLTRMLDFFDTRTGAPSNAGIVSPDPAQRGYNSSYAGGV